MPKNGSDVTVLLQSYRNGDPKALEELAALVYSHLHQIARRQMNGERASHTLQPTALVNEVLLRMFTGQSLDWESRGHFYRVAATMMRRFLIDYAKQRNAKKRLGEALPVAFDEALAAAPQRGDDLLALDEALTRLAITDEHLAKVVELRYFAGLSIEETAAALGCSTGTVKRDWIKAKLWLFRDLKAAG